MLVNYNNVWFDAQQVSMITTHHTWSFNENSKQQFKYILKITIAIHIHGTAYVVDEIIEERDKKTILTKEEALELTKHKKYQLANFINKHCKEQLCQN